MFMWIGIGLAVALAFTGLVIWLVRRRRRKNAGPISIVMFRTSPRGLTEADVRAAFRRAHKAEPQVHRIPVDEHTVGFGITTDNLPPLVIIDSARTYLEPEHVDDVAARLENPESRRAFAESKAWVSVDALGVNASLPKPDRAKVYTLLAPIAAELIDDRCTLLYQPAEDRAAPADGAGGRSERLLRECNLAELFNDNDLLVSIVPVEQSDKKVNAAIEEARKRIPEFCSAWEARGVAGQPMVKGTFITPDGQETEYMWVSVTDMTDDGFVGTVENNPAAAGLPLKGTTVTVRLDDIVDWAYLDEREEPHGLFVDKVLMSR